MDITLHHNNNIVKILSNILRTKNVYLQNISLIYTYVFLLKKEGNCMIIKRLCAAYE